MKSRLDALVSVRNVRYRYLEFVAQHSTLGPNVNSFISDGPMHLHILNCSHVSRYKIGIMTIVVVLIYSDPSYAHCTTHLD